jgi:hypothetical protein
LIETCRRAMPTSTRFVLLGVLARPLVGTVRLRGRNSDRGSDEPYDRSNRRVRHCGGKRRSAHTVARFTMQS